QVSIVNHSLSLASNVRDPPLPFFYKDIIASVIKTVVDGFVESVDQSGSHGLVDTINILRPDRVFMFIVDMHYKVTAAAHPRHKCNYFAGIEVLVNLLDHRAAVPSTFSYLLNLAGQYVDCHYLSVQCCHIVSTLLKISKDSLSEETNRVLGEQLQFLTSKLVACVASSEAAPHNCKIDSSLVVSLLQQITVSNDSSLHGYIKELGPFPEFDVLHGIREFQQKMSGSYSPRDHFLKLVKRSFSLPPRFLLCGLKALHSNMSLKAKHIEENVVAFLKDAFQGSDKEVVDASWNLVRVCSLQSPTDVGAMVSDFISKVGIRDPHRVSFYLPGESHVHACGVLKNVIATESSLEASTEISSEVVLVLFRLFKKYLMEDSVQIIDITSQVLRGILSTECGQKTLEKLDSYEKSLIKAHSRGVNLELVERLVGNLACKTTAKSLSIEDFSLWSTTGKTFEMWICPLVYTMISYCDDVILRLLCHDIVLVKSEVAEFLFTHVIVNIAGREASHLDLCAVQECVFCESNMLIKSIQVTLCALNELRLCHVMVKMSAAAQNQHNIQKVNHMFQQQSGPSSALKSHSVSAKLKNLKRPSGLIFSTLLWEKVYWLAIDYLLVAKAAVKCGSYFTAFLYVEHWCEQHFHGLNLGSPDFSHHETLPLHVEILVSVVTQINEPDSLYGIVQSHKLTSQVIIFEHEGNWTKALEYYDLQVRSEPTAQNISSSYQEPDHLSNGIERKRPYKGLIRSLEQMGCKHLLDVYCQGLTSQREQSQNDQEFIELQYEAAWRAGNWGFFPLYSTTDASVSPHCNVVHHFNGNLHSCLRSLQEGEYDEFHRTVKNSKQALLMSIFHASSESTEFIYSTILRLQIFYHLEMAWDLRWSSPCNKKVPSSSSPKMLSDPVIPSISQLQLLNENWNCILEQTGLHMNLLEPFIAFRRALLRVLNSVECTLHHLWKSASVLRKGSRISQAAAALHEFKLLCSEIQEHSNLYWLGRLEEAKLLRAQGRNEMAINLAEYISQNHQLKDEGPDVFRLVGKWLAETRSSNSRIILEKYLKHAVNLADNCQTVNKLSTEKRNQMHFHLAHYADLLFRSHEERLCSSEWQVAMRLRKHKGDREDYALKIQLLQKQLAMDQEEENKLQEDRDNLLCIALSGYKRCLIIGEKYDVRVVFRLISLWFSLSTRQIVIDNMLGTIKEVQSYKFIQLVYQIASRIGSTKLSSGPPSFQFAVLSLVKKLALDHPYHTIYQLLALANGDRIKDKQRSRNSFVVDMDKKIAAEDLLTELSSYHRAIISQMKEMVEIYIKLAEMETRREVINLFIDFILIWDILNQYCTNVPVVTSHFPIDRTCQYPEGFFPHFKRLADTVTIMEGINAPKVVECLGSDGKWYRQLAKSGNDDLRQDAVMEQFFGLVNTFLSNNRDTWKRRLSIRTYKVIPFTPSAGVLEWVNGTFPLGEYLIGSARNGGAHGRYGVGDWTFMECRRKMTTETNKRFTFQQVCENFRPVMHHFFLERFLNPADWFERRLAYTRSVAASSMVGYIVGLGDRHARNILIDEVTAEVVHIDLGVAFEQGLMLKTPERVPFRLTRDIIDGMGVTGVEGVFRRCCEESLSVMRTNKDALLKIIEVHFFFKPL
ncbi:hypothetical protein M569_04441, partial [Genlisea aurea]